MTKARVSRPLSLRVHSVVRWLHTWLSLVSMALVLFFSVTGVTLNHPEWIEGAGREFRVEGVLPSALVSGNVDKLAVAEQLRARHGLRGTVDEFRVDDQECTIAWKAPGYSADVFVRRADGHYEIDGRDEGALAFFNDLHKGRHSGSSWARAIDVSGFLLTLVALSGLGLVWFLKRIRLAGFLAALGGVVVVVLLVRLLVR
jgi:hypothetical protein